MPSNPESYIIHPWTNTKLLIGSLVKSTQIRTEYLHNSLKQRWNAMLDDSISVTASSMSPVPVTQIIKSFFKPSLKAASGRRSYLNSMSFINKFVPPAHRLSKFEMNKISFKFVRRRRLKKGSRFIKRRRRK